MEKNINQPKKIDTSKIKKIEFLFLLEKVPSAKR